MKDESRTTVIWSSDPIGGHTIGPRGSLTDCKCHSDIASSLGITGPLRTGHHDTKLRCEGSGG